VVAVPIKPIRSVDAASADSSVKGSSDGAPVSASQRHAISKEHRIEAGPLGAAHLLPKHLERIRQQIRVGMPPSRHVMAITHHECGNTQLPGHQNSLRAVMPK
jgi:hypothetical protein